MRPSGRLTNFKTIYKPKEFAIARRLSGSRGAFCAAHNFVLYIKATPNLDWTPRITSVHFIQEKGVFNEVSDFKNDS